MTRRNENLETTVGHDASKRDFVKKAAYVAPAILSMQAYSALAKAGSNKHDDDDDKGNGKPCKPKRGKRRKC